MITRLEWDSKCFGYEVGKLVVDDADKFNLESIAMLAKGFRLIYIFSKEELKTNQDNFSLADKKTIFSRKTEYIPDLFPDIKLYEGEINEALLRLAFQSGEYSRFRLDKSFCNAEFQKLYSEWISKSVKRINADDVIIAANGVNIEGFITLSRNEIIASIGLVAVDPKCRGKGIGSYLVKYAINKAYLSGCKRIEVATQLNNIPAVALYKSNSFEIKEIVNIYHYWV